MAISETDRNGWAERFVRIIHSSIERIYSRSVLWYLDFILPFMSGLVRLRLQDFPEYYNFKPTSESRIKFRKRFKLALGITFLWI